jgi:nucleoside-diphosphate-sugar epimerase
MRHLVTGGSGFLGSLIIEFRQAATNWAKAQRHDVL